MTDQVAIEKNKLLQLSDHARDIIIFSDRTGQILEANSAAITAYGCTKPELLKKKTYELRAGSSTMLAINQLTIADANGLVFEARHMRMDGSVFDAEISSFGIDIEKEHYVMHIVRDISERKRAEARILKDEMRARALFEMSQASSLEIENLARIALGTALRLSGSKIGFIAFVAADVQSIHLIHWGKVPTLNILLPEGNKHFAVNSDCLWGEIILGKKTIIANNLPEISKYKTVLPEEIVAIDNFLGLPLFDMDKLQAIVVVANKEHDYLEDDIRQLTLLFSSMWSVAYRKKSEKQIHDLLENLEKRNIIEKSLATIARHMLTSEMKQDSFDFILSTISNLFRAEVIFIPTINLDNETVQIYKRCNGCTRDACLMDLTQEDICSIAESIPASRVIIQKNESPPVNKIDCIMEEHKLNFLIVAPIYSENKPVGLLLTGYLNAETFNAGEEDALKTIAELCGMYLTREYLNKKIETKNEEISSALESLKQTQMQLIQREKLAGIGQLAAGVAHEINNPLGFVSSNMDVLSHYAEKILGFFKLWKQTIKQPASPINAEYAGTIDMLISYIHDHKLETVINDLDSLIAESQDGVERIAKIVSGLKLFARQDSGEDYYSYNFNTGITTTLTVARNEIKYYADVSEHLQDNLPDAEACGSEINQVLLNMIVNSVYAIREKSEEERGTITISTWDDHNNVYCSIEDTGIGIPEEKLSSIFNPFFTTKPIGQGTGLGLSISYEIIVNKHHGQIMVESKEGQGAKFTIVLPLQQ